MGDFVKETHDGGRTGGLRSPTMEQSLTKDGVRMRLNGARGWVQVKVEPSGAIRNSIYIGVTTTFSLVALKSSRTVEQRSRL